MELDAGSVLQYLVARVRALLIYICVLQGNLIVIEDFQGVIEKQVYSKVLQSY